MTEHSRAEIRSAYLDGATVAEIAERADVSETEVETYLRWWCDRGCPNA